MNSRLFFTSNVWRDLGRSRLTYIHWIHFKPFSQWDWRSCTNPRLASSTGKMKERNQQLFPSILLVLANFYEKLLESETNPSNPQKVSLDPDIRTNLERFLSKFKSRLSTKVAQDDPDSPIHREIQFRFLFETPTFRFLVKVINKKLGHLPQGSRFRIRQEFVLNRRRGSEGASHEAVDSALLLELPTGERYLLGLLCCKSNIQELQRHAPQQGISYIIKSFHPEVGPQIVRISALPSLFSPSAFSAWLLLHSHNCSSYGREHVWWLRSSAAYFSIRRQQRDCWRLTPRESISPMSQCKVLTR